MEAKDIKMIEDMSEIVMIENEVGILQYVNDSFCRCFGVSKEESIGRSCFDFIIPEDRKQCNVENIVTPENPYYRIEGRSKKKDGKIIWLEYIGRGYFDENGKVTGFQEIAVDVTRWKEEIEKSVKQASKTRAWIHKGNDVNNVRNMPSMDTKNGKFSAVHRFSDIYTNNENMKSLKRYCEVVATRNVTVLIEGESGTGKELFAQAIHNASRRKNGPFVAINCGAIPETLIESELFGYEPGAFTGASKEGKKGVFEMASGGTLFLDEIGEMPISQQIALLRVMETSCIKRIGGFEDIPVDVRIVCATNKILQVEAKDGRFRSDLYYRLNVINIHIPPLRERKDDIFLLMSHFLGRYSNGSDEIRLNGEQLELVANYSWPGNIRELKNFVERIMYVPEGYIDEAMEDIKRDVMENSGSSLMMTSYSESTEEEKIRKMMDIYDGNISLIARKLNISRNTLYKRIREYGI